MPRVLQGQKQQADGRFAIVVSRYNETITSKLLDGALETLANHGIKDADVVVAWVPGAWEIPLVAKRLVQTGGYAAVLCLGAVIRGETTHDQYINQQLSNSLGELAIDSGVPVAFGVLTCNSMEQAIHRAGGNVGNKGVECAEAALEMVHLLNQVDDET
ncbi:MAG: 6,7-dimethyl-8-ribityllumazine synthase [Planctomycetota bacterium]|nr:6,7-dimethyl-8-ribityllumazine synthase [Planctomycetota bacterium]